MILRLRTLPANSGFSRVFLTLFGTWSLLVLGALSLIIFFSVREDRDIAYHRAMDGYHKDLTVLRWASERGGVYVPLDGKTPPNPYLAHRPDRDVSTTQGKVLTLVNPAYMTRMIHELSQGAYGLRGHLTSLKPIRPENAPDPWERKALEAFEGGAREFSEVVHEHGRPFMRFMGAFVVEPSCLACHGQQGYKVGDIRGGLSVTVPVGSEAVPMGLTHELISILTVLALWLLGGVGLLIWVRKLVVTSQIEHQMLANIEDSALRFQQLFDASPAPMAIHRDGHLTHTNAAAVRLLEAQDPKELLGRNVMDLVHPDFQHFEAEHAVTARLQGLPSPPVDEIFITLKGRQVWVTVQTVRVDLPHGPATLVFAQDLTEVKQATEDRRKLEAEIQHAQKLESLGSLAGGIAHDMNNVLAAVMGMSSVLKMKHEGDAALVKSIEIIEHAATRGRDLVKGLTDFARKGLQQPEVMDLNGLVQKEVDLLVRTSRHRFAFDIQLEGGLPPILGESSALASAIMNLCVNAFDAMPRGGTLTLRTSCEGSQVNLLVGDTGDGIPADILPRVTEPFFTTKPVGRGTGLGLAMVYGTVKAHGGSLDIQSEVGVGTRITLRFPAVVTGSLAERGVPSKDLTPKGQLHILLVDDDELIRSVLPTMLQQLGHQVETASGGLEALRRLDAGLPADLVILDHNMPGLSGADTLPRIIQLRPNIRIMIATGFMDTELKVLLSGFPTVVTLQKPFTLEELNLALEGT